MYSIFIFVQYKKNEYSFVAVLFKTTMICYNMTYLIC